MKRTRLLLMLAMVALSGCAGTSNTQKCLEYGFRPQTDGMAQCLLTLDKS